MQSDGELITRCVTSGPEPGSEAHHDPASWEPVANPRLDKAIVAIAPLLLLPGISQNKCGDRGECLTDRGIHQIAVWPLAKLWLQASHPTNVEVRADCLGLPHSWGCEAGRGTFKPVFPLR